MSDQVAEIINEIADSGSIRPAVRDWLTNRLSTGAAMTVGIPGERSKGWLGERLAWWPAGIPSGRRMGIASSRLGRQLETHRSWFTMLRAACAKIDRDNDVVLNVAATTTSRFLERCAELFGLTLLTIHLPTRSGMSLEKWFEQITKIDAQPGAPEVYLSPPIEPDQREIEPRQPRAPLRDRTLFAASDQLLVFHVRPNGNLQNLIEARLNGDAWEVGSTTIALGPKLVPQKIADHFLDHGAVGWFVPAAWDQMDDDDEKSLRELSTDSTPRVIALPNDDPWPYLTHCTRRCDGPWPAQDENEFLDDLILDRKNTDHSALAALCRIVEQKQLTAGSSANRGSHPVVSFTAASPIDLKQMRTFRPHRGRWDFEPYGICIHRDWLEKQGAKPVQYGDDELWKKLPEADRPFFQKSQSHTGTTMIDWTIEQEWRCTSDVDLSGLPHDAVFLLVPTSIDATRLAQSCPWPVAIMPPE